MKRLFTALTATLLISCELTVDVDVPFERNEVTANAFFTPDSLWSIQLSRNRHVLDEQPFENITDARVVIFEGDSPIDTLANVGSGRFRSDNKRPEPGKMYAVSVSVPGYPDLRATSFTPSPSPIASVEIYESNVSLSTMIKVKIIDDGAKANFYELYVEVENEYYDFYTKQLEYSRHKLQLTSQDPLIQNEDESFSSSILFRDILFNGREIEPTFETSGGGLSYHGTITVTLRTISEEGYNYLITERLQDMTSGDPFAQPVNVHNNIQNGFGVFAGYSSSVYTKSRPKPVIHSVDPPTGKAGDRIMITGENFIYSPDRQVTVVFSGAQHPTSGQIVTLTPSQIEVVVPDMAVTGKIVVLGEGIAVSDSDFVIID